MYNVNNTNNTPSMPRKKITDTQLKFGLQTTLKRKLQSEADARGISLSAFIRLVLNQYLQQQKGNT